MSKTTAKWFDIRWRLSGSNGAWSTPKRFTAHSEEVLDGVLTAGKTYDLQARGISACGAPSPWADQGTYSVPAINQRISQGNVSMLTVGGIRSAWQDLSITYTATPTDATISATAATLRDGVNNPTYGASSVPVSGSAGTTVTYWLYYDDPDGTGGNLPLEATTVYEDLSANQSRVWVGNTNVEFPTSGSGTGTGGSGGGGPCPTVDSWTLAIDDTDQVVRRRCGDVRPGDRLLLADEATLAPCIGLVSYSQTKRAPCVEVSLDGRPVAACSTCAPLLTPEGQRFAPEVGGQTIAARSWAAAKALWRRVTRLRSLGEQDVQHITCQNGWFWISLDGETFVLHHNLKANQGTA